MTIPEIKTAVRERDGNRCTECGMTAEEHVDKTGKTLEVHRLAPGSIYSLDGCVTLCGPCHRGKPKRKRGQPDLGGNSRAVLQATPQWIERATRAGEHMGLNLSAFIRMVISQYLDRAEAEQPPPPRRRQS